MLPLRGTPPALGAALAAIAFASSMFLAWGPRATPVAVAAVLAVVFTMGLPPRAPVAKVLAWQVVGAGLYVLWALTSSALLQRRWRRLALAAAVAASVQLLRTRAAMLRPADAAALQRWVATEARLAERLQAARDLIFAAGGGAGVQRQTAVLLRLIDLRDLLLASGLDVDRLDEATRRRWSRRLRALASALESDASVAPANTDVPPAADGPMRRGRTPASRADEPSTADGPMRLALSRRFERLQADIDRIAALRRGGSEALPLSRAELRDFVAADDWPLAALKTHRTLDSPVLRHALRTALALTAAFAVAFALPWASHPQWLVLSVAVVLRGTLEQTLARRNARVLGTLLGCVVVVGLAQIHSAAALAAVFAVAVGVAHGYAVERYLVTAVAATVMALLQAHLVAPDAGFPVAERAADTLIGAALAWAFSYVLPSWERKTLPRAIERLLATLRDYAAAVLGGSATDAVAQRQSRRAAYDALLALSGTLQRSAAEPSKVRPPLAELAALIDQAQRLMAHLSLLRLMLARGDAGTDTAAQAAARDAVDAALRAGSEAAVVDSGATAEPPAGDGLRDWLLWRLAVTRRNAVETAAAAQAACAALQLGDGSRTRASGL